MKVPPDAPPDTPAFSLVIGAVAGLLAVPLLGNLGMPLTAVSVLPPILFLAGFTLVGRLVGRLLSFWIPVMPQVVRFGIVGGLNTLLEFCILNTLMFVFSAASGWPYAVFKAISFSCAAPNAYVWNKFWTFGSLTPVSRRQFLYFLLSGLAGMAINVGTASLIVNGIGAPEGVGEMEWANIGAAVAILVATAWNFSAQKFMIFGREGKNAEG
jgi:putative flippase GtrA